MEPALVVHGGCGTPPPGEEGPRRAACERAADVGWRVLQETGSALDAAEATVRALEDEALLNAGTGAYLQADGVARLDASIMAGDGRAGAVAQVPLLPHPVSLARYLLEQDAHVMLAGTEALTLAARLGQQVGVVATPAKIAYWQENLDEACRRLDYAAMATAWKAENPRLGTVGCVALDTRGQLAAATSTGGTGQCYPGRVGDTPVIGAGTYCTPRVGVSLTGVGERILVKLAAKRLADLVGDGVALAEAARRVIEEVGPGAGLIALGADGEPLELRNTPFMATARRPSGHGRGHHGLRAAGDRPLGPREARRGAAGGAPHPRGRPRRARAEPRGGGGPGASRGGERVSRAASEAAVRVWVGSLALGTDALLRAAAPPTEEE